MTEKESKLPKWAQDELRHLRMQVAELTNSVAIMAGNPGTEENCQGFYSRTIQGTNLDRVPVLFGGRSMDWKLRDDCFITLGPTEISGKRFLSLNAVDYKGNSNIIVQPWASNAILVRVGE